jgi:hypothetical protein
MYHLIVFVSIPLLKTEVPEYLLSSPSVSVVGMLCASVCVQIPGVPSTGSKPGLEAESGFGTGTGTAPETGHGLEA